MRAATKIAIDGAAAATAVLATRAVIPARSVRRRPSWSASAPAVSSAAARPRLIALRAQVRQTTEAPNVAAVSWMVGTTVVKSTRTSRVATPVIASVRCGLGLGLGLGPLP